MNNPIPKWHLKIKIKVVFRNLGDNYLGRDIKVFDVSTNVARFFIVLTLALDQHM